MGSRTEDLRPWRADTAAGMLIEWDLGIRMDDGLVLRADVFRPAAPGRYPVILSYGPYAKGLPFQQGYPDQWRRLADAHPEVARGSSGRYQNWEAVDPEKWVPDGYACVRVDSRGAGRSPGFLDPFCPRETRDFYLCIEWAGGEAWSNGKVGLLGISYYAINQWHVASLRPPHLAAICPWEGAADWYRDMSRHGGIVCVFWDNWMKKQVITVQHGLGDRGPVNPNTGQPVAGPETLPEAELAANRADLRRAILSHPLEGEYNRERSPVWSRITVPLLSAANWGGQGLHPRGNFEGFMRAASPEKWLEVHGLEHWTEFYTDYGLGLQKRFFDHYLKGADNGWERQPRVLLQIRHVDRFVPRAEEAWPIPRTRWTRVYLDAAAGTVAPQAAARAAAGRPGGRVGVGRAGRWGHPVDAAAGGGHRGHRSRGGQAVCLVEHHRRRSLRRAPRLRPRRPRSRLSGRPRPPHPDRPGLAPRLSPAARSPTLHRVAPVPQPRSGRAAGAGRRLRARRRDLADESRGAGRPSHRPDDPGQRLRTIGGGPADDHVCESDAGLRAVPPQRS